MTTDPQGSTHRTIDRARDLLEQAAALSAAPRTHEGRLPAQLQRLELAREQLENKLIKVRHFDELSRQAQNELSAACLELQEEVECIRLRSAPTPPA
ncbi:MAG: hypothetical protein H6833_07165 [Planctomycetes bacterium]|nr:hypothetical protein [Planctomycetota bacterium]